MNRRTFVTAFLALPAALAGVARAQVRPLPPVGFAYSTAVRAELAARGYPAAYYNRRLIADREAMRVGYVPDQYLTPQGRVAQRERNAAVQRWAQAQSTRLQQQRAWAEAQERAIRAQRYAPRPLAVPWTPTRPPERWPARTVWQRLQDYIMPPH